MLCFGFYTESESESTFLAFRNVKFALVAFSKAVVNLSTLQILLFFEATVIV